MGDASAGCKGFGGEPGEGGGESGVADDPGEGAGRGVGDGVQC